MLVWDWRTFRGASEKVQLVGRVVTAGATLSGLIQSAATAGGGLWRIDCTGIDLRTPDAIRRARAWSAYLDGGVTRVVVPFFDLGRAPRPLMGGLPGLPGSPAPSTDYFAQDPSFGAPMIVAQVTAAAALRATALSLQVTVGSRLYGGEHFALNHPVNGWRCYRVAQAAAPVAGVQSTVIRPPLREAVIAPMVAEFDVPRCVMALDPSKSADLEPEITAGRFATVNASFVEAF